MKVFFYPHSFNVTFINWQEHVGRICQYFFLLYPINSNLHYFNLLNCRIVHNFKISNLEFKNIFLKSKSEIDFLHFKNKIRKKIVLWKKKSKIQNNKLFLNTFKKDFEKQNLKTYIKKETSKTKKHILKKYSKKVWWNLNLKLYSRISNLKYILFKNEIRYFY